MARIARVILPGYPQHVTPQGVRSLPVYFRDEDHHEYIRFLKGQGERLGMSFIAYCLMTNHVHLIAIPADETSLSKGIGEARRLNTRMINLRDGVRGCLFQGRFFSCPPYPHNPAVRYVKNNPVRAKMVQHAWEYKWSNAAYHAGSTEKDLLITESDLLVDIDNRRLSCQRKMKWIRCARKPRQAVPADIQPL